jgi:competence protein ComEC
MRVHHPPAAGVPGNDNANSTVLAVEWENRRILLPGDLEEEGLRQLLRMPSVDCDVLMAPHHGSSGSDPAAVASWCSPEWVVISGGNSARTRHAAQVFSQAGTQVLHTADVGAVRVQLDCDSRNSDMPPEVFVRLTP